MKILASKGDNEDFAPIYHVNKKVRQSTLVELIRTALKSMVHWLKRFYRMIY